MCSECSCGISAPPRLCGLASPGSSVSHLAVLAHPDDLKRVCSAGLSHGLADREHDKLALLDLALLEQEILGGTQHEVALCALLQIERPNVAVERHLALRRDFRRERENRAAAVVTRHP